MDSPLKDPEPVSLAQKNKRLLFRLIVIAVGMFCFCYALVPFYNLVCKATGINGKVFGASTEASAFIDTTRTVTVQFTTQVHEGLKWEFHPEVSVITLHPGQTKTVQFYAENNSDLDTTVQAIPSISPGVAAQYLKKTECFCFAQQTLLKNQKVEMPVVFHLDPGLPKDIRLLTLSYTLYDASNYLKKDRPKGTTGRLIQ